MLRSTLSSFSRYRHKSRSLQYPTSAFFSSSASNRKVAVVTGASSGIGRAVALRLARDGLNVAALDLPSQNAGLNDLKRDISALGRKCSVVVGDAAKDKDVKELVDCAVATLGGIDVMVANAGICKMNPILDERAVEALDTHYALNLRGVLLCYKYAAMQMVKQGRGGRIIGASSIAGKQGQPFASAYVASKFAVVGLTQSAASELGRYGITVNAYAPGAIDTDMARKIKETLGENGPDYTANPVGRVGHVDDIASLVSFLASDRSGFITGQSISVNGGTFFG